MTQASVRLRPYGTISGAVLTRARLPIARIFGEIPAAKELGLVFACAGQSTRARDRLIYGQSEVKSADPYRRRSLLLNHKTETLEAAIAAILRATANWGQTDHGVVARTGKIGPPRNVRVNSIN